MGYGFGYGFKLGRRRGERAFPAISGAQTFGAQVVARAYAPIVGTQSFAAAIVAEEGGGFDPLTDLTGTVLWFDMQDASAYTTSAGNVATVVNKKSSVSWAEATNRPAFAATGINGHPACDHDGTNDCFTSTEAAVVNALKDQLDFYFAAVLAADDLDAVEVLFGACAAAGAGAGNKRFGTNTTGAGKYTAIGTNDAVSAITRDSTENVTNSPVLFEAYSISQVTSVRINGGAAATVASAYGTLTPDPAAIGCRPTTSKSFFFDGKWGEIILCTDGNAAGRAACATYLIDKWGIT
jgi:hypothetical protein